MSHLEFHESQPIQNVVYNVTSIEGDSDFVRQQTAAGRNFIREFLYCLAHLIQKHVNYWFVPNVSILPFGVEYAFPKVEIRVDHATNFSKKAEFR